MPPQTDLPPPDQLDWNRHALFLDFDGTLAPIVDRPPLARLSLRTRKVLDRLPQMAGGAVAILTGRELSDLDGLLSPLTLLASGSHGLEIRSMDGSHRSVADGETQLAEPGTLLRAFAEVNDLLIEFKLGAVALHYRSKPKLSDACRDIVERVAGEDSALRFMHGNMVSEVALAGIDKGTALRQFMDAPPFERRVPIMAGDDVTDEDAIIAAQELGGFGIKVGDAPTAARYRAASIETFLVWLDKVSLQEAT